MLMPAEAPTKTLLTPRLVPGRERLVVERVLEAARCARPRAVPCEGEEGDDRARRRGDVRGARRRDHGEVGAAEPAGDAAPRCRDGRVSTSAAGEEVVEAAAAGSDHDDVAWPELERGIERQLEVGRVLRRRVALDARPGRLGLRPSASARDRVEVADRRGRRRAPAPTRASTPRSAAMTKASRGRLARACSGTRRATGHDDPRSMPGRPAPADHRSLRWHYPDQVRGSVADRPPSQPGSPSSPGVFGETPTLRPEEVLGDVR